MVTSIFTILSNLNTTPQVTHVAYADSSGSTKILYASNKDNGNYHIYTINANGTGQTQLTQGTSDYEPKWSPDGTKIVYTGGSAIGRGDSTTGEIYIMNADGTGQTRLTNNNVEDGLPSFSPDGTKIVFCRSDTSSPSSDIYIMNADGTGTTRLTTSAAHYANCSPSFSPDGTKIVFTSSRDTCLFCSGNEIYIMNADGTGQTRLTNNLASGSSSFPSFSHDGTQILYDFNSRGKTNIYTMNPDGTGQHQLSSIGNNYYPSFSPDGTKIIFSSDRTGWVEIYTMSSTGEFIGGVTRVTNDKSEDAFPSFIPQTNPPPNVNAGPTQTINPGSQATLQGSASDSDGDSLTFEWKQLSGTPVQWTSPQNILQPTFIAPSFDKNNDNNNVLQFQLGVDDGHGNIVVAVTTVNIKSPCPTIGSTNCSYTQSHNNRQDKYKALSDTLWSA